eukprot:jgi/Chlat1/3068/Chrsp21S00239
MAAAAAGAAALRRAVRQRLGQRLHAAASSSSSSSSSSAAGCYPPAGFQLVASRLYATDGAGDKPGSSAPDGNSISVDRSGLFRVAEHSHNVIKDKQEETELIRHLKALIRFRGGPITVAEYMHEVLTHPTAGFYMTRDMIGVWTVCIWQQLGHPAELHIVELGPGRGTLLADLLRGTKLFKGFATALRIHLVEVSPAMRKLQAQTLQVDESTGRSGISGTSVEWHNALASVPNGPAVIIAHEFFDALPVHQFQRTERGWCERLLDIDDNPKSPYHLRYVLSPGPTPASTAYVQHRLSFNPAATATTATTSTTSHVAEAPCSPAGAQQCKELEVCPQGMAVAQEMARRVSEHGGAALVVDYGKDGIIGDSAIKQHKFVYALDRPGTADLSAHVDFAALRQAVASTNVNAVAHGPVSQSHLLLSLGIQARCQALIDACESDEQAEALFEGYRRLTGSEHIGYAEGMGELYKAIAITRADAPAPVGFEKARE